MTDDDGVGSNAVWAVALVIIVALIAGLVYYSGILRTNPRSTDVDINISAPSVPGR
jgi:predicted ABC-type exoprotein transport system permease subunit